MFVGLLLKTFVIIIDAYYGYFLDTKCDSKIYGIIHKSVSLGYVHLRRCRAIYESKVELDMLLRHYVVQPLVRRWRKCQ